MKGIRRFAVPLSVVASAAVGAALVARAQEPGYKGSKVCMMCHKTAHKDLVAAWQSSRHAAALWPAEQAGTSPNRAIVGDFNANPGFQQAQVKWVLGSGKNAQAYVAADYKVLPQWWEVGPKAWKPALRWHHDGRKMVEVGADTDARTACLGCHATGYDPQTAARVDDGVACEACHGPGAAHVGKRSKETIVRPQTLPPDRRAMVCGQCHGHGVDNSGKYAFPVAYKPGDDLAAAYALDGPAPGAFFQQYSEWSESRHAAKDVLCASCHEPHGVGGLGTQLRKEGNALCLDCHKDNMPDNTVHKAAADKGKPACSMCHMPRGNHMFKKPGA